jgi:hypothetical protein
MKPFPKVASAVILLLVIAAGTVAIVGCRTYGSREVRVKLNAIPREVHGDAFLVPIENWAEITGNKVWPQPFTPVQKPEFRQKLEQWHIAGKLTPLEADTQPYRCIYVVKWNDSYKWILVNFAKDREATISFAP